MGKWGLVFAACCAGNARAEAPPFLAEDLAWTGELGSRDGDAAARFIHDEGAPPPREDREELALLLGTDPAPKGAIADSKPSWSASASLRAHWEHRDSQAPPFAFRGSLQSPWNLDASVSVLGNRLLPRNLQWDPNQEMLTVDGVGFAARVPQAYLRWRYGPWTLIAGTFQVGFAERLVIDSTRSVTPHGFEVSTTGRDLAQLASACKLTPESSCRNRFTTPDFTASEAFRGIAASIEDWPMTERAHLSSYAFASFQERSLYQYRLWDRRSCPSGEACPAPNIAVRDTLQQLKLSTLPSAFRELAMGGRVALAWDQRMRAGITGYWAVPFWINDRLDFQAASRWPGGGPFATVGADAELAAAGAQWSMELARSFDSDQGGGFGVVARTRWRASAGYAEVGARFFDQNFDNPHGHPVSASDSVEGQAARNELGIRCTWTRRFWSRLSLRLRLDGWTNPFADVRAAWTLGAQGRIGANLEISPSMEVSLLGHVSWRQVPTSACTEVDSEPGDMAACDRLRGSAGVQFLGHWERLRAALRSTLSLDQDASLGASAIAQFDVKIIRALELRLRARFVDTSISAPTRAESRFATSADAHVALNHFAIAAGYDYQVWIDKRLATRERVPNPEHRLRLELRSSW